MTPSRERGRCPFASQTSDAPAKTLARALFLVVVLSTIFQTSASAQILFSPYKDVTINANWNTGEQQSAVTGSTEAVTSAMPINDPTLTWAFATGTCGSENWAGITPAMEATNAQEFVNAGKYYIVSTGGANGTFDCPSNAGMQTFIQHYATPNMLGVDYDIEGGQSQAVIDDLINSTIFAEQQYPSMRFSFTLATLGAATTGSDLNSLGDLVMTEIGRLGLGGNYYIDLMAFDYGSVGTGTCVVSNGACDMAQSAIAAAESLHAKYGTPYSHIELCLMIGQADSGPTETLSLANVDTVVTWAKSVGLGGIHYWSFDRDQPSASSTSTSDGTSNSPLAYNNEFITDLGSCTGPGGACSTPPPSQPFFSLSSSPGSLSVAQGSSGTSAITVSSGDGFDSPVALSVSGLPAGVTASLSPGSVTPPAGGGATATLTLSAGSSAGAGTTTVTITGTGSSGSESTTVALTVTGSGGGGTAPGGCAAAWSSTQVYTGGMTASEGGIGYVADYWTLGQDPATNNGPAGSGQPWISQGPCGSQPPSSTTAPPPPTISQGYNVDGIYNDGTSFSTGGVDNDGTAYSSSLLGSSLAWNGTSLSFGPADAPDAYTSESITLPAGAFSTLNLLATAVNGNQAAQTFTVNYSDGSRDTFTQSLSDWATPQGYSGEAVAASTPYRDDSGGGEQTGTFNLYGYSLPVNPAKSLASLVLPSNRNVVVLAAVPNLNGSHTLTPQSAAGARLDDLSAGTAAGNTIDIYTANQTGAQSWVFSNAGVQPTGYYNLAVSLGAYCLTASGSASGSPVQLDPCDGDPAQAWQAVPMGASFVLHPANNPSLCLDVQGGGVAPGTIVQALTCTLGANEQWNLI